MNRGGGRRGGRAVTALALAGVAAGLAVGGTAASPASPRAASAAAPSLALYATYRITTVPRAPSGLYRARGTFSLAGTIADSGTASLVYRITARGPDTVRGVETLRGRRGRLVVRFQGSAVAVGSRRLNERPGPPRIFGLGASRIASGTRAYRTLRARTARMGYTLDFRRRTATSLHTYD